MKFAKNQKQRNPRYFLKEGWFGFGDDEPETPEAPKEDAIDRMVGRQQADKAAIDSARQEYHKLKSQIDRAFGDFDDEPQFALARAKVKLDSLEKLALKVRRMHGDEADELEDKIHKTSRFYSDKLYDLKQKSKASREAERASRYRPEPEYDILADPATDRYEYQRGGTPPSHELYLKREGITKSRLKQIIREEIKRLQK